jgi:hypothetical protein
LPVKRRKRKRIEISISQLNGQFSMNVNFAKTFESVAAKILYKNNNNDYSIYEFVFV